MYNKIWGSTRAPSPGSGFTEASTALNIRLPQPACHRRFYMRPAARCAVSQLLHLALEDSSMDEVFTNALTCMHTHDACPKFYEMVTHNMLSTMIICALQFYPRRVGISTASHAHVVTRGKRCCVCQCGAAVLPCPRCSSASNIRSVAAERVHATVQFVARRLSSNTSNVWDSNTKLIPSLVCCGTLRIDSLSVHVPAVHRSAETI